MSHALRPRCNMLRSDVSQLASGSREAMWQMGVLDYSTDVKAYAVHRPAGRR